jgi:hypothetical protein
VVHAKLMTDARMRGYPVGDTEVEVVRYCDTEQTMLYCRRRTASSWPVYPNPVPGKCPYFVAERPKLRQIGVLRAASSTT